MSVQVVGASATTRSLCVLKNNADFISLTEEHSLLRSAAIDRPSREWIWIMPQPDPDVGARETLRLIGPDPKNWVPDQEGIAIAEDFDAALYASAARRSPQYAAAG
jgi:hypothetical protein